MSSVRREFKFDGVFKCGSEEWVYRSYAFLARRGNKVFLNVLTKNINSYNKRGENDFILSRCIVNNNQVTIEYSDFNNETMVDLAVEHEDLVKSFAQAIANDYLGVQN